MCPGQRAVIVPGLRSGSPSTSRWSSRCRPSLWSQRVTVATEMVMSLAASSRTIRRADHLFLRISAICSTTVVGVWVGRRRGALE